MNADFTFEKKQIRTRFAPSPTGFLHIGGIRTAIFNWAFARRHGGKFYLRIDDTDVERHVDGAVEQIIKDMSWIGLDHNLCDERIEQGHGGNVRDCLQPTSLMRFHGDPSLTEPGIVYQSLRGHSYMAAMHKLRQADLLYHCFCTEEETTAIREACRKDGRRFVCPCRDIHPDKRPWEKPFCMRFNVEKAATEVNIVIDDLILGDVSKSINDISDAVLIRSNGGVVYNLACVVDDIDMRITHVIRGQEHLSNSFLQSLIYKALGQKTPEFAHIPFICAPNSTKKLSKRDAGSLDVMTHLEEYRQKGYLPQALFNYLSHLGWAMDASTEKWTAEEFVSKFGFEGCVKTPAAFDPNKLFWLQGEYMKELPLGDKLNLVQDWLREIHEHKRQGAAHIVPQILKAGGDRIKLLSDIEQHLHFWEPTLFFIKKDANEKLKAALPIIKAFMVELKSLELWSHDNLEALTRSYCETNKIKTSDMIHGLRAATTGKTVGIGVFDGMAILGKEPCLIRMNLAIDYAEWPE